MNAVHRVAVARALMLALIVLSGCSTGLTEPSEPRKLTIHTLPAAAAVTPRNKLRLATLNVAHGRGEALNQLLVGKASIEQNLDTIGSFLQRETIDIVALQEADAASAWSGNFDHSRYLAEAAGYPWWIQDSHAELGVASYGTAILSALPVTAAGGRHFSPSPPTARKGFTVAEIQWQTEDGQDYTVDVISIHMDFSRKSVRTQQLEELDETMRNRSNPVILMGDFNSEALASRLVARAAESERRLHTWDTGAAAQPTYKNKQLDWIILSDELEFVDYRTAPDVLSDHRAVIATVRINPQPPAQ